MYNLMERQRNKILFILQILQKQKFGPQLQVKSFFKIIMFSKSDYKCSKKLKIYQTPLYPGDFFFSTFLGMMTSLLTQSKHKNPLSG